MLRNANRCLALFAGLLPALGVASAEHYRFRHFGPEEGLNTSVSGLIQDRVGFLWAGTSNGLYRYDGAHFQRFGVAEGLPSASIRSLMEAPDGVIWAVTGRGLARFSGVSWDAVDIGTAAQDLRAIGISPSGRIYVGYDHGILTAVPVPAPQRMEFQLVPGAPREPVNGILAESNGVWFNCGLKLCQSDGSRLQTFDESSGLPPERWQAMLRDRSGDLWIRGPRRLFVLPRGGDRFVARDQELPQSSNSGMSVIQDRQGRILVSTDRGVARLIDGRWQLTGTAQGLETDAICALLEDREGSIWIGLWGVGLARWPGPGEWTNWTTADGLSNSVVWAILRHPSGSLWLGTDRGLVRFQTGSPPRTWTQREGLAGDKVKSLVLGPDGAVWAGCLPGGVSRIDPKTGSTRTYGQGAGLEDDRIIALHLDGENHLWASSSDGLYRAASLAPGLRFERIRPPGSSDHAMFFRFHSDSQGRLWVGSTSGLFRFDHGGWTRFSTADGLKADSVTHVSETADGAIWISYREPVGVARLTFSAGGVGVEHYSRRDGLPSDYILFLGLDRTGQLWVGTDNGVAVHSAGTWRAYTHEDGLVWDDCAANAFLAESDGSVWIGSLKGLSRFRPSSTTPPWLPPPAAITSLRFGEEPAHAGSAALQVPFRDRDFLVTFAGLSFVSETKIRFRYRLIGLDDRWVETGLREARYTSLPPGSYRFEVMARNGSGPWSPAAASVSFVVIPPWWATWWYRSLALACGGGALFVVVRARVRRIRRENRRLESAVRERTGELELQKSLVERQKREIEELLKRAQESSRLKSEFLANMSHEIRTPMNGVIGMTQLVLNTALDAEQREYLSTVRDSAESLLVVINDILDFSKIEAGKMELALSVFALRKCLADAVAVFNWKAEEKGIRLTLSAASDVPEWVTGDADRLRQVLLNLIGNAMKFTERGEVAVSVSPEPGRANTLHFTVRDTGVGIPAAKQAIIFEAFAQADGSAVRRRGGTGLGLAICSKLVRLMNGRIWVESTPGAGSCFHFTARLGAAQAAATPAGEIAPASVAPDSSVRPLRILLVEDNAVNQKLAQRAIEKMGHSIVIAGNGARAVEACSVEEFDLVLMDLQMPELDGFGATSAIREVERASGRHTPIIAMTAHAMHGDRDRCLRAGMDDYISKPVDLLALARMIERYRVRPEAAVDRLP